MPSGNLTDLHQYEHSKPLQMRLWLPGNLQWRWIGKNDLFFFSM